MTDEDPSRDLLAGLAPGPLSAAERMEAAAARMRAAARLPDPIPYPMRHALGGIAASLESTAVLHRRADDGSCSEERGRGTCTVLRLADALLGNPL